MGCLRSPRRRQGQPGGRESEWWLPGLLSTWRMPLEPKKVGKAVASKQEGGGRREKGIAWSREEGEQRSRRSREGERGN